MIWFVQKNLVLQLQILNFVVLFFLNFVPIVKALPFIYSLNLKVFLQIIIFHKILLIVLFKLLNSPDHWRQLQLSFPYLVCIIYHIMAHYFLDCFHPCFVSFLRDLSWRVGDVLQHVPSGESLEVDLIDMFVFDLQLCHVHPKLQRETTFCKGLKLIYIDVLHCAESWTRIVTHNWIRSFSQTIVRVNAGAGF